MTKVFIVPATLWCEKCHRVLRQEGIEPSHEAIHVACYSHDCEMKGVLLRYPLTFAEVEVVDAP